MPRPEARPGLDAVGEVILTSPDGIDYRLQGTPSGLVLNARRLSDLFALRRHRRSRTAAKGFLGNAHRIVAHTHLPVRVCASGIEVARLAPSSRGGWIASLTGLGPVDVSLSGVVRALLTSRGG